MSQLQMPNRAQVTRLQMPGGQQMDVSGSTVDEILQRAWDEFNNSRPGTGIIPRDGRVVDSDGVILQGNSPAPSEGRVVPWGDYGAN